MTGLKPGRRNVGLLFPHYALFPHRTVAENIADGLRRRGIPAGATPARVGETFALVRLFGFGERRPPVGRRPRADILADIRNGGVIAVGV